MLTTTGNDRLLTPWSRFGNIATCFVSSKTSSFSPTQFSVRAGVKRQNLYQVKMKGNCDENKIGDILICSNNLI